eukprot:UN25947
MVFHLQKGINDSSSQLFSSIFLGVHMLSVLIVTGCQCTVQFQYSVFTKWAVWQFWLEWLDVATMVVMCFVYEHETNAGLSSTMSAVYFSCFVVQLSLWTAVWQAKIFDDPR